METWKSISTRLDALNLKHMKIETDYTGMPIIHKERHDIKALIPFHYKPTDAYAHFFLDDYQFERVWNTPKKYVNKLKQFKGTCSPDFSLYTDYPLPIQIWNTYRNRWLGQYWQNNDIKVLPTIVWSNSDSYPFCFKGIETGSDVAISSIGIMTNLYTEQLFLDGYYQMIEEIRPKHIYLYGYKCPETIEDEVIFIENRRFNNGR